MKGRSKQLLALFLSASMAVTPMVSAAPVLADETQAVESVVSSEVAETEETQKKEQEEQQTAEDQSEKTTEEVSEVKESGENEKTGQTEAEEVTEETSAKQTETEQVTEETQAEQTEEDAEADEIDVLDADTGTDDTTSFDVTKVKYKDGTYTPKNFTFAGGTGKVTITCPEVKVENGIPYATIVFSSSYYTKLKVNHVEYTPISGTSYQGAVYSVPMVLNQDIVVTATTTKMTEPHDINYTINVACDVPEDTSEVDLSVKNETAMFKADEAILKTDDAGKKSLVITLSGSGYHYLYKGTYEQAVAIGDDPSKWIAGEQNAAGKWVFTIPLEDGEKELAIVAISNSYYTKFKAGKNSLERAFYARQAVIDYDAKKLTTNDYEKTTALTVTNNVKMFSVAEAGLHTVGGPNNNTYEETLKLTMGSDSFDKVYVGTKTEAEAAETTLAITDRKVDIPVKGNLDKAVTVAFHSKKNDAWYERLFTVSKKDASLVIDSVPVPATGLTVSETAKTVYAGDSFDLTATVEPKDSTDKVTWASSNDKIATVDKNGKVTAVAKGTATITATAGTFTATCEVTVKATTFTYTVAPLRVDGSATPQDATDVKVTVTDTEGNSTEVKASSNKFVFDTLDAHKTYTVTVSREGYNLVTKSGTTISQTNETVYTGTITDEDDAKTLSVIFQKDELKAALKEIPANKDLFAADSMAKLEETVASVDQNEKIVNNRNASAAKIDAVLKELKLKDGFYATDLTTTNMTPKDVTVISENGKLKVRFRVQSVKKIYFGKASVAKTAKDDDPKMLLSDNDMAVAGISETGYPEYQFTMPISALYTEISFVGNSGASSRWGSYTLRINTGSLQTCVESTGITLDKTEAILNIGDTIDLNVSIAPENATYKNPGMVSSDETVAKIVNGKIQAIAHGTATITVKTATASAECKVSVHALETIPAVAATCTSTGLTEGKKCSECGEILVAQKVTDKIAHTEEIIPAKAATCTATGLTEGKKCSVCGTILVVQKATDKIAHTEEIIPAKAATCTATGLTEGKKCSVCGEILVAQKTTPKIAHKLVTDKAVPATPGHTGLTEGQHCSVCGTVTVKQQETPALPTKVSVKSVSVKSTTSAKIAAGKKVQLTATVAPANATNQKVTWTSSNTKVATVSAAGLVTMNKKAGGKTVVINAVSQDNGQIVGSIKLTCMKGYVRKVSISGKKTVKAGKTLKLKAKVSTKKGKANKSVVWTSSNPNLATVSNGKVKTFKGKKGTVKITIRSLDGTNKSKTVKIKIK